MSTKGGARTKKVRNPTEEWLPFANSMPTIYPFKQGEKHGNLSIYNPRLHLHLKPNIPT